jgi:UPF0288 family protein (methanogenesis marker protein 3)
VCECRRSDNFVVPQRFGLALEGFEQRAGTAIAQPQRHAGAFGAHERRSGVCCGGRDVLKAARLDGFT